MESLITFCVLIFHLSLVASFPFPKEYNLAYQQPQLQYPAQPQQQIEPSGQQYNYGNYQNFQPSSSGYGNRGSFQNLYYPSHQNFVNSEPALQQRQAYNNFLLRQPTAQNLPLSQSYLNPVPLNNAYNQGSPMYEYVPQEQQMPLVNSPTKQFFSGQSQGNDKIAAALTAAQTQAQALQYQAAVQAQAAQIQAQRQVKAAQEEAQKLQAQALQNQATQASTSSPQFVNPYQQIYHHVANNMLADGSFQPLHWQNLWKKYSADVAPPKPKKRYLVIHPDGTTEYVDQIETIAKKHPNYLLVNGGSVVPQSIASSSPNQAAIPSTATPQANKVSSEPLPQDSPNASAPQDSSFGKQITAKSDTDNQVPLNTAILSDSDHITEANDPAVLSNSDSASKQETTDADTLPSNPQTSDPDSQDVVSTQTTNLSSDEKPTQTSDDSRISENSLPSLGNSESTQNLENVDSQRAVESSFPEETAPDSPVISGESIKQTESKAVVTPSIEPTFVVPDPAIKMDNIEKAESKLVTPSIEPTFVVPDEEDDALDLSKLNTAKPPTIFLTSDSDILRELLGDDEISVVYFFQIKPKTDAENDAKTIADSNDTALQTVETKTLQ